jgi:hypothetical protein
MTTDEKVALLKDILAKYQAANAPDDFLVKTWRWIDDELCSRDDKFCNSAAEAIQFAAYGFRIERHVSVEAVRSARMLFDTSAPGCIPGRKTQMDESGRSAWDGFEILGRNAGWEIVYRYKPNYVSDKPYYAVRKQGRRPGHYREMTEVWARADGGPAYNPDDREYNRPIRVIPPSVLERAGKIIRSNGHGR